MRMRMSGSHRMTGQKSQLNETSTIVQRGTLKILYSNTRKKKAVAHVVPATARQPLLEDFEFDARFLARYWRPGVRCPTTHVPTANCQNDYNMATTLQTWSRTNCFIQEILFNTNFILLLFTADLDQQARHPVCQTCSDGTLFLRR